MDYLLIQLFHQNICYLFSEILCLHHLFFYCAWKRLNKTEILPLKCSNSWKRKNLSIFDSYKLILYISTYISGIPKALKYGKIFIIYFQINAVTDNSSTFSLSNSQDQNLCSHKMEINLVVLPKFTLDSWQTKFHWIYMYFFVCHQAQ